jgi:hypothetical protein
MHIVETFLYETAGVSFSFPPTHAELPNLLFLVLFFFVQLLDT